MTSNIKNAIDSIVSEHAVEWSEDILSVVFPEDCSIFKPTTGCDNCPVVTCYHHNNACTYILKSFEDSETVDCEFSITGKCIDCGYCKVSEEELHLMRD